PALLEELAADQGDLPRRLSADAAHSEDPKEQLSESRFRFSLNQDAMATEKLAQGIRGFVADQIRLENLIAEGA
ncbi:unnamed protein product, partial [Ectocarpus sp. 12 AP-2014]